MVTVPLIRPRRGRSSRRASFTTGAPRAEVRKCLGDLQLPCSDPPLLRHSSPSIFHNTLQPYLPMIPADASRVFDTPCLVRSSECSTRTILPILLGCRLTLRSSPHPSPSLTRHTPPYFPQQPFPYPLPSCHLSSPALAMRRGAPTSAILWLAAPSGPAAWAVPSPGRMPALHRCPRKHPSYPSVLKSTMIMDTPSPGPPASPVEPGHLVTHCSSQVTDEQTGHLGVT